LAGHAFSILDQFQAANNFYGGQLGLRSEFRVLCGFLNVGAKLALGSVSEAVTISGLSRGQPPPGTAVAFPVGFYASQTNSGQHAQNNFALLPEFTVNLGYHFTQNIRAWVGYNFLFLSSVARPGNEVDIHLNPSQVPWLGGNPNNPLVGPAVPAFYFNRTDLWAQGINFGLQVKF
jgi:hypothetical protein